MTFSKILKYHEENWTKDTWDRCDVCDIKMHSEHYAIMKKEGRETLITQNWVCSEKCFTMWIFQEGLGTTT